MLNNAVNILQSKDILINYRRKQHTNEHLLQYEFQIIDDGIGMSKEFLNRIGQPFEQEKNQFYGKESEPDWAYPSLKISFLLWVV